MTFTASALISYSFGEVVRFRRKNSFIDMTVQNFKEIADFEGAMAVYRLTLQDNNMLVLRWSVRKPLKKMRGMIYGNQLCTEKEVPYYCSGCVNTKRINDIISITTLQFLNEPIRERLCLLLKNNIGFDFQLLPTKKDNMISVFLLGDYSHKTALVIASNIEKYLNNTLKDKAISVYNMDIEEYGNEVIFNITLAVRD